MRHSFFRLTLVRGPDVKNMLFQWLMQHHRPDLMYLSTTDYIQHKAGPGTKFANDFYIMIDGYLAALDDMGAIIVATADHGMNDKHDPVSKQPNVIYL